MLKLNSYFVAQNIVFKKQNGYVFLYWNKYFFFTLVLKNNHRVQHTNTNWHLLYSNWINTFYFFFRYMTFVGKSYKISFNKKCINLNFNKANENYLLTGTFIRSKLLSKNKIFFKTFSEQTLFHLYKTLLKVRPQNIFTGRGIKLSQSIILKKKGKVSSYTTQSSLF